MEFFGILGLLFVGWIIFGPFIVTSKLKERVSNLEYEVARLKRGGAPAKSSVPVHEEKSEVKPAEAVHTGGLLAGIPIHAARENEKPKKNTERKPSLSLEQIISTRLGVWVGAVALILGAVFLVKYSIDEGWLSPAIRVMLSGLFGAALVGAAELCIRKANISNGTRIAQGFAGAGFAALYGALYSATSLYNLLPSMIGFAGLALVTMGAIISALRFGAPVAYLGLFGGFAVPLLVRSDAPDALPLFGYLFVLSAFGMIIARRQKWWGLAWAALICSILWMLAWIVGAGGHINIILVLFALPLVLMTAAITAALPEPSGTLRDIKSWTHQGSAMNTLSFIAFTLFLFAVNPSQFDVFAWGMSLCMGAAICVLARVRPHTFAKLLLPMQVALMLLLWRNLGHTYDADTTLAIMPRTVLFVTAFAGLFSAAGYLGMRSVAAPATHAWLLTSSLLTGFLVAYSKLKGLPSFEETVAFVQDRAGQSLTAAPEHFDYLKSTWLWGMAALGLTAFFVKLAERAQKISHDENLRNHVLAALAVGGSGFLTTSIVLLLPDEMWTIGLALQVLALLWIYKQTRVNVLPKLTYALLVILALSGFSRTVGGVWDIVTFSTLTFIGVPSIAASYIIPVLILGFGLRICPDKNEWIFRKVYYITAFLAVLGASYLISNLSAPVGLLEQSLITLVLLTGAALVLQRSAAAKENSMAQPIARALLCVGLWRLVAFHLFQQNPLHHSASVGSWWVLNAGLVGYVLPALPLHFIAQSMKWYEGEKRTLLVRGALTFLFLLGAGFIIRQIFQGVNISLAHGTAGMPEQISYSALGVCTGAALLHLALKWKDVSWRWLSLIVIVLTVGKVFLIDAAQLSGLLRVFSFMGLGLSLMGLSAFYSRYVFKKEA